jgi:hypothetical protein
MCAVACGMARLQHGNANVVMILVRKFSWCLSRGRRLLIIFKRTVPEMIWYCHVFGQYLYAGG